VAKLAQVNPCVTSFMQYFGRRDEKEGSVGGATIREWVPLTAIGPILIAAAIRCEDPRFFSHHGVDWWAIRIRLLEAARRGTIRGGASTITQQLARNLYLTPTRSLARKLRELLIAWRLDRALTKSRIVEIYLNVIEWGPGVWGCGAAADYYFGKIVPELDLFESTFLPTLLPAPKAGLRGALAARSRGFQLTFAHHLLLSGMVPGEACARCCARVRELHRLLASGMELRPALAGSAQVAADADAALIADIIADLDLPPVPTTALLGSGSGADAGQRRAAFMRLCARFGEEAMMTVLRTGCYDVLRTHPNARQARPDAPELDRSP
jgi:monofunctional biosynthetic peptidoglycan transglycosylase